MATGVPVETIRTWERRYGFPSSQRNNAGHRIYDPDAIEYLRLVTAILSRGYRPSQLEGQSREELEQLLQRALGDNAEELVGEKGEGQDCDEWLKCWMEAVEQLERHQLERWIRASFSRLHAFDFFSDRLHPFLVQLGVAWEEGRIQIYQEHFASECIRDFLVSSWRPLSDVAQGPAVVLATLSGERHCLGLHMAALAVALADRKVMFLGADTPVSQVASAVESGGASTVALSISECTNACDCIRSLTELREHLDDSVRIVIGGQGAPPALPGVETLDGMRQLSQFLDEYNAVSRS